VGSQEIDDDTAAAIAEISQTADGLLRIKRSGCFGLPAAVAD